MNARRLLQYWFGFALLAMLAVNCWASWVQPVWEWTGLTQKPNHAWTITTLMDAYFGFCAFYAWVLYKEPSVLKRVLWFIAIMGLGNIGVAAYALKELRRLNPDDSPAQLLVRRNG